MPICSRACSRCCVNSHYLRGKRANSHYLRGKRAYCRVAVLDNRAENAQWFIEEWVVRNLVFIDECGYNVWTRGTRRTYGRVPRGHLARRVVSRQRGRNLNVTLPIAPEVGLVHHTMAQKTVTREGFKGFQADTARRCQYL